MLYWGIFTSGFVIGSMFAVFLFDKKSYKTRNSEAKKNMMRIKKDNIDPDTLFDQITQINYFPQKITKETTLKI